MQIQIQHMLFMYLYLEIVKRHLKFNHKEESITFAIFYFILQSYSTKSSEFTEKKQFYLSALSCSAGSRSGNESGQKFRIHADPDSQHWFIKEKLGSLRISLRSYVQEIRLQFLCI